jgi:hypothetical protein
MTAAAEREAREPGGTDRRIEGERRRGPGGWTEMRARLDGIEVDRRRPIRRFDTLARALLPFLWRGKV